MSRLTLTTTTALAAAALAFPAGASAASVEAAAHFEAHAVANSDKALDNVRGSAAKAKRLVARSQAAMKKAYAITVDQGNQSKAKGLEAAAQFSAAAKAQGDDLQAIVDKGKGGVKAAAADALAKTGRMEAELVAKVAKGLERQQTDASESQGDGVSDVGGAQADLTASIAVAASEQGLRNAAQKQLDKATAASIKAQARLAEAVAELRNRTEEQDNGSMASAQASLQRSAADMADALRRSGRWEVSFEKTAGTGDGPASASAYVRAHAVVEHGGRR